MKIKNTRLIQVFNPQDLLNTQFQWLADILLRSSILIVVNCSSQKQLLSRQTVTWPAYKRICCIESRTWFYFGSYKTAMGFVVAVVIVKEKHVSVMKWPRKHGILVVIGPWNNRLKQVCFGGSSFQTFYQNAEIWLSSNLNFIISCFWCKNV